MTAKIISGTQISADIREELKQRVNKLKEKGITPGLAAILVGEDPGSLSYLRGIAKGCEEVGLYTETIKLPEDIKGEELERRIEELNKDSKFHGIILQLPLPKHLDTLKAESAITPEKDVDGTNPVNTGKLLLGEETFLPSTPYGVQELLIRSGNSPEKKHVVICGRSNIVGKPLMGILVQKQAGANATVTVCHTGTKDLPSVAKQADILVAAMGKAKAITADMVREGAVVIDVGVNMIDDPERPGKKKMVGDVDFDAVKEKAAAITPVPGGTGPVTTTMLMANTVKAAERMVGG
ncbi:MAG: bifunctional 5,10-methylene-tetrahydrofolate dehydrogenase/5,10-methylene-tetrahydrofolate cyclohydrolase [Chloroflexi bacterium CG07_land_8_20_14_0_80_51_10]|nr:MAG: bifunctional 5,10-methylene-tetrahydrofolate dehydrogenase/5,10-methylene-tetrahydrofolate cyclohydrolase [Chloroflexi bacterium CG07_land_8_20_14_0_80_51_10]